MELKETKIRSERHRRFIASLPCCTSGIEGMTQAAHIRSGSYSLGMKPCDSLVVPLSVTEHTKQHRIGEAEYWHPYGGIERVKTLARNLYQATGDEAEANYLINNFRRNK